MSNEADHTWYKSALCDAALICPLSESITIPSHGLTAARVLEDAGFEAWFVGGFVRDSLLGRMPGDIDIATNAHWTKVRDAFAKEGFTCHETGVKHGTITVVVDGEAIEITTYRKDESYSDGRHPESVTFVSRIEEDLARRDFTVNALAYNPNRGLVDAYDGLEDLKRGTIRCVGDPETRFKEDALRILRACRFRSKLGFRIEADTLAAMKTNKCLLRHISAERIYGEIEGLLLGEHVHDAIMETVDVLSFVLPELVSMKSFDQKTPYHIYDVLEHTAWVVQHTPPVKELRWAALFHDMGKPGAAFEEEGGVRHFYSHAYISVGLAHGIMERLPFSTVSKEKILILVKRHDEVVEPNPKAVKRLLNRMGEDVKLFEMLCDLKKADALSQAPFCHERAKTAEELKRILASILDANEAFSLKHLNINGRDLMDLGLQPGPRIGEVLNELLSAVIDERVRNDHDALIERARELL